MSSASPAPEPALPWPRWQGETPPEHQAVLVHAEGPAWQAAAGLDDLAALAARGVRVLLHGPAATVEPLARAWGVWALWQDEGLPADARGSGPAAELARRVAAWVPLAALADVPHEAPDRRLPWPRLHLATAGLQALIDAETDPARARAACLWIGLDLDAGHALWPQLQALPATVPCALWWAPDHPPPADADLSTRRLAWPAEASAEPSGTPRLERLACLDLLFTDRPETARWGWALGREVIWLGAREALPADLADRLPGLDGTPLADLLQARAAADLHPLRRLALDDAHSLIDAAIAACQRGRLDAARSACLQLLVSQPRRPDAWRLLGTIARAQGAVDAALRCFERVTEIAGAYADGWRSLAELREATGRAVQARSAWGHLLALTPQDDTLRERLAADHRGAGETARAIALYREGLQHRPGRSDWQLALGALLIEVDQPQAACDFLEACARQLDHRQAEQHAAAYHEARELLARALEALGDPDGAAACRRELLAHAPHDRPTRLALARHYRRRGQLDRAAALLQPHEADPPGPAADWALECWLLARRLGDDPAGTPADAPARWAATVLAQAGSAAARLDAEALAALAPALGAAAWQALLDRLRASALPFDPSAPASPAPPQRAGRHQIAYLGSAAAIARHREALVALLAAHDAGHHAVHAVRVLSWQAGKDRLDAGEAPAEDDGSGLEVESLGGGSDTELAERIANLGIELLVDLDGDGPWARPGIWARRPAPLAFAGPDWLGAMPPPQRQALVLGTEASTGTPWRGLTRPGDPAALRSTSPSRWALRERLGLPAQAPVLACLNPVASWPDGFGARLLRLLQACPPARLWLAPGPDAQAWSEQVRAAGLPPARLHRIDPHRIAGACAAADLLLLPGPPPIDLPRPDLLGLALAAALPVLATADAPQRAAELEDRLVAADWRQGWVPEAAAWEARAIELLRHPRELLGWREALIERQSRAAAFRAATVVEAIDHALRDARQRSDAPK